MANLLFTKAFGATNLSRILDSRTEPGGICTKIFINLVNFSLEKEGFDGLNR